MQPDQAKSVADGAEEKLSAVGHRGLSLHGFTRVRNTFRCSSLHFLQAVLMLDRGCTCGNMMKHVGF